MNPLSPGSNVKWKEQVASKTFKVKWRKKQWHKRMEEKDQQINEQQSQQFSE